jgi:hydroxypyruvate reductase/glycerate 2-kinase
MSASAWRQEVADVWWAGVAAVQPAQAVPRALAAEPLDWSQVPRLWLVGGGKAGTAMTLAACRFLEQAGVPRDRLAGWVNVPADTVQEVAPLITLHPARPTGMNLPTAAAVMGTERILQLIDQTGPGEWVLCLVSGGGSALLCAPAPGLTLEDKLAVTQLLHRSGADIQQMNTVRKHLSQIKGGGLTQRLARRGWPGPRLLSLVISDVIGDPLEVIASGPTYPDPTTFADALSVVDQFGLRPHLPAAVLDYLRAGVAGQRPETLKTMPQLPDGTPLAEHRLIATNAQAVAASAQAARDRGWQVECASMPFAGDVLDQVRLVAERLRTWAAQPPPDRPVAWIAGGETTVTLPAPAGAGGRNQHFILALLAELPPEVWERVTVLCAGTDGEDGTTQAAGAFADRQTWTALAGQPERVQDHLRRFDAYPLLDRAGALFRTGLTQTNVMDLRIVVLWPARAAK